MSVLMLILAGVLVAAAAFALDGAINGWLLAAVIALCFIYLSLDRRTP